MVRLADAWLASDEAPFLQITFHSCTLLPGATPFVRDAADQARFLRWIWEILSHLDGLGCRFRTLLEASEELLPARNDATI